MRSIRSGTRQPTGRDPADGLLDAAEFCFDQIGPAATTMDDIARQAGVSRATLYRTFANREAVVSGVILRAARRYLDRIRPRIVAEPDLGSAVLTFVETTIQTATQDNSIAALFVSDDRLADTGLSTETSVALFELVTEFLRPVFTAHWIDLLPGTSVDDAAEWILRTILSLLTVRGPKRRSRDGLHDYLVHYLLPALVSTGTADSGRTSPAGDNPASDPCA